MERLILFHLFFQDFWVVFHCDLFVLVIAVCDAHEKLVVIFPVINLFIAFRFYFDSQDIISLFILPSNNFLSSFP